jgi:hypothetical protein
MQHNETITESRHYLENIYPLLSNQVSIHLTPQTDKCILEFNINNQIYD